MAAPGLDNRGASSGYAPYQESALKAALRRYLSEGGIQASLAGLGSVPRGANFGEAFLAASGGAGRASTAAHQAAQEYAMKQEEAQQREEMNRYTKMNIESEIKSREKPPPLEKVPGKQQDYEHLIALGHSPEDARQIVYGLTSAEQIKQKSSERPPKEPKEKEDLSWLSGLVKTTRSGKKFLDVSELAGKEKATAVKWATNQGLTVAGSNELGGLQDVDTARANVENIKTYITGLLPKDSQGRNISYPGIKLSTILQTNEKRAAFGAWRAAAIRNLRAMAGSKGLRINQAEINQAIKNDIPNITDTYGVALKKLGIVGQMLDSAESPVLNQNWSGGSGSQKVDLIYNPQTGDFEAPR
jgi:hypothetical protein